MKWIFTFLVLANLAVYGWYKLDATPLTVQIQNREKNASAVKVVTGQLGEASTPAAASPVPTEPPQATNAKPEVTPAAQITPKPQPSATPAKVASICTRWTGITGEQIDSAREKLKALGITSTETSSGESTKVWVYMPPLETLDAAKAKATQLAAMGVTDYFVVNNGGRWQNAISLGIFSTREAGERHLEELKALGVKSAVVRDRDDTLKQASFSSKNLTDAQLDKLNKLSLQYRGSIVREVACK
ncbi:hypothetical protein HQ393_00565 [Chitinibacter bivalviorum]|uniref:SPOR domain-containing protein n=1 Tax=Chitinibacter bivalviorum TaxID=2739434 RepID=A0A7H9BH48_9NEIS|nr:SPOR domain-containing protein [Chitinibacter bivalviorum]QLG86854.1 hypothetical protein HQ393_00565 [Chitinibacter bivalviorum]